MAKRLPLDEEIARERCADCACLVSKKGKWTCDESGKLCRNTDECPEGFDSITELIHNKKHDTEDA